MGGYVVRRRFGWFDVVVGLIVVAALVAFFVQKGSAQERPVSTHTVEIDVLISNVRPVTASAIKVGDRPYDLHGVQPLGEVTAKQVAPTPREVPMPDGKLTVAPSPLYSDVTITLRGEGDVSDRRIMFHGVEARIGGSVGMETRSWASSGFIVAVRVVD